MGIAPFFICYDYFWRLFVFSKITIKFVLNLTIINMSFPKEELFKELSEAYSNTEKEVEDFTTIKDDLSIDVDEFGLSLCAFTRLTIAYKKMWEVCDVYQEKMFFACLFVDWATSEIKKYSHDTSFDTMKRDGLLALVMQCKSDVDVMEKNKNEE